MSAVRGHRTPALAPSGAPALVSVVIAVGEHDDRLPRALASVLAQTGVRLDVVVVTAWSLAVTDPRVRVLPSRAGALEARNLGLGLASGDAVMVLPVTDVLTEGALERAAALLAAHPWVGAVYGAAEISDATTPEIRGRIDWTLWSGSDWIERTSRHGSDLVLDHAALVRRSVADALGGYAVDLPRTADLDYWLRLAAVSGVGRINGVAQTLCRPLPAADPLAELRERHDALERFFESAGHDWSGRTARSGDRRERASRAVAREAMRSALLHRASASLDERADGARFASVAAECWPAVVDSRDWRRFVRRGEIEQTPSRRRFELGADRVRAVLRRSEP